MQFFFKVAKCRDHASKKIELLKFRGAEYKNLFCPPKLHKKSGQKILPTLLKLVRCADDRKRMR